MSAQQNAALIEMPARFDRSAVAGVASAIAEASRHGTRRVRLDLSQVETFDSAGMATVVEALQRARRTGLEVLLVGVKEPVLDFFSLVSVERLLEQEAVPRRRGIVERTGAHVTDAAIQLSAGLRVVTRALGAMAGAPFRRERARFGRVVQELDTAGRGAIPIVALIAFLLGLILAMQAWVQLRIFAAEIFVADMVAVSVTREIGPLMTAILISARSGSSIAAQLGTMVINEEVAALRQMGVNPLAYLVAPKIVALALAGPCLTVLFSAVAIAGGLLFGVVFVGVEWSAYLEQTRQALAMSDLLSGLLKATVFGGLIASVACTFGIGVSGGPEGVGRATTRAVVASVFLIIVVDAAFVMLLRVGT